jgi:LPPG:FO 2-phospho-L-lactate transferase
MRVVAIAGGVGGARLALGLGMAMDPADLTVVVNTGDDFEHLGLSISPDLDTVMYTLAGIANPETGWGIAGETFDFLAAAARLGAPAWFRLGDRDLATHVERTRRLRAGASLTDVTRELCAALGVGPAVLPMSDEPVRTKVHTEEGTLDFQEYFVKRRCEPRVTGFDFAGLDTARPSRQVMTALGQADAVVLCPSNPFVSTAPILALPGVRDAVESRPAVAVSPIVGGSAVKGPAAKMLAELELDVSAQGVARMYSGLVGGFVLDATDAALDPDIRALGMEVLVTDTMMRSDDVRRSLAREALAFAARLRPVRG